VYQDILILYKVLTMFVIKIVLPNKDTIVLAKEKVIETGFRKASGVVGLGLSSALFAILHLCFKIVVPTASTDSHPVATRYISFDFLQRTRYGTHPGAPFAPNNPKPASQAFPSTLFETGETRTQGRVLTALLIACRRHSYYCPLC
jgi:hypothetical protein